MKRFIIAALAATCMAGSAFAADTLTVETAEVVFLTEITKLDDLSLALVGGGSGLVELG